MLVRAIERERTPKDWERSAYVGPALDADGEETDAAVRHFSSGISPRAREDEDEAGVRFDVREIRRGWDEVARARKTWRRGKREGDEDWDWDLIIM
jgi:hypothetical protein